MPLTEKGQKIMSAMKEKYGERGEEVFYRSKNAGTITGVDAMGARQPFGQEDPVTKGEKISTDQESMLHPPSLLPEPDLEHPQQHPGESTPPEPATGDARPFGSQDPVDCGDQITAMPSMPPPTGDVADLYGAITGGAIPQGWGEGWKGPTSDALPTGYSLADMVRENQKYWSQWKPAAPSLQPAAASEPVPSGKQQ
jgi:hypothetical protein